MSKEELEKALTALRAREEALRTREEALRAREAVLNLKQDAVQAREVAASLREAVVENTVIVTQTTTVDPNGTKTTTTTMSPVVEPKAVEGIATMSPVVEPKAVEGIETHTRKVRDCEWKRLTNVPFNEIEYIGCGKDVLYYWKPSGDDIKFVYTETDVMNLETALQFVRTLPDGTNVTVPVCEETAKVDYLVKIQKLPDNCISATQYCATKGQEWRQRPMERSAVTRG